MIGDFILSRNHITSSARVTGFYASISYHSFGTQFAILKAWNHPSINNQITSAYIWLQVSTVRDQSTYTENNYWHLSRNAFETQNKDSDSDEEDCCDVGLGIVHDKYTIWSHAISGMF